MSDERNGAGREICTARGRVLRRGYFGGKCTNLTHAAPRCSRSFCCLLAVCRLPLTQIVGGGGERGKGAWPRSLNHDPKPQVVPCSPRPPHCRFVPPLFPSLTAASLWVSRDSRWEQQHSLLLLGHVAQRRS